VSGLTPQMVQRRRSGVGIGLLIIFLVVLGIFLLPFAFPTQGAIVAHFTSRIVFSPNTRGGRPTADVTVDMRNPSHVTLTVNQSTTVLQTLVNNQVLAKGAHVFAWDGKNSAGRPMPNGTYTFHLLAVAGQKSFDASRHVTINRVRPSAPTVHSISANLGTLAPGTQCAITVTPPTPGPVRFSTDEKGARVARAIIIGSLQTPALWNWNGRTSDGQLQPAGVVQVLLHTTSVNGFTFTQVANCWIGNLVGDLTLTPNPRHPTVTVHLASLIGRPLSPSTPVVLQFIRRATTAITLGRSLGSPVGHPRYTTAGAATTELPHGIPARRLWLTATTSTGTALMIIGSTP